MTAPLPVSVRRAAPVDLELLRSVRLRALRTDPGAFGSTYAREVAFDREVWLSRVTTAAWLLASVGPSPAGLMAFTVRPGEPVGDVTAVWVAPEHRGAGVGDALLSGVVAEAESSGVGAVSLYVVDGNRSAERLYLRHGFSRTGRTKFLASAPGVAEVELRRPVR